MLTELEFAQRAADLGGQVYIVGGWVRDFFIGRAAYDKDYVICGLSLEAFLGHFEAQAVGRQFPVFLMKIEGRICEVAFARTERKKGRGYLGFEARFDSSTTIEEDLYRRDTRMNSMAFRLPGMELVDPFGGRHDIAGGLIRATSEHFGDDPVRALRAARQAAQLDFKIDPPTMELMAQCRGELAEEPSERILAEAAKALESPLPARFFEVLRDASILDAAFPELAALVGVEQPLEYHHGLDAFDHTMEVLAQTALQTRRPETRFAALVHDLGKGATPREEWPHHYEHAALGLQVLEAMNRRMTLPRPWMKLARFVVAEHMRIPKLKRAGAVVKLIQEIARKALPPSEIAAVIRADSGKAPDFLERFDFYQNALARARKRLKIPEALPEQERAAWLTMRLAEEYSRLARR